MENQIYYIDPALLKNRVLWAQLRENSDLTYYWSDNWSPSFYASLAYEGCIAVTMPHEELGSLLLPELQESYAVLDWQNLQISKKVRRFMRQLSVDENRVTLHVLRSIDAVAEGINTQFGENSWLTEKYRDTIKSAQEQGLLDLVAIELRIDDLLIAGELGYFFGTIYTSLTGFCTKENSAYANAGTLQMVLLAKLLEKIGVAFWNLGHPQLEYKVKLGAQVLPRKDFLQRWEHHRDETILSPIASTYAMRDLVS